MEVEELVRAALAVMNNHPELDYKTALMLVLQMAKLNISAGLSPWGESLGDDRPSS